MTRSAIGIESSGAYGFREDVSASPPADVDRPAPKRSSGLLRAGFVYAVVTVFVAIGAVNSQNNLLFIVFGLLVGCVLASGVIGGSGIMGVRITRVLPSVARVGQPLSIRYRLTTRNRVLPACALIVQESPAGSARAEPNALAFLDVVRPRRPVEGESVWTPTHRGLLEFPLLSVRSRFPFGLTEKRLRFDLPASVRVRPPRVKLSARGHAVVRRLGSTGATASRRPGPGDEFVAIREYAPGDSTRRIAWKPTARLGAPVVRLPGAPMPRRAWVALATPPNATSPSVERAVAVAGTLIENWVRDGQAVGLLAPGVRIEPAVGRAQASRLLDALAVWQPPGEGVVVDAGACRGAVVAVQPAADPARIRGADATIESDDPGIYEGAGVELPAGLAFEAEAGGTRWWAKWRPARAPSVKAPAPARTDAQAGADS